MTHWIKTAADALKEADEALNACACNDRPKSDCPGEWEPECDLGANEAHVEVSQEPVTVFKTTTTTRRWIEIPDGWALVPVEPTEEMVESWPAANEYDLSPNRCRSVWAAMLAAAPQYKEQE